MLILKDEIVRRVDYSTHVALPSRPGVTHSTGNMLDRKVHVSLCLLTICADGQIKTVYVTSVSMCVVLSVTVTTVVH